MFAFGARAALAAMLLSGCMSPDLKPVEVEQYTERPVPLHLSEHRDVDILFVIDNSGSMGEEQANLAANFAAFIEVLEAPSIRANYRIGVTTTDNGNPWCPTESTTPEGGKMVLSSCKNRLADFVSDSIDVREAACTDICSLDAEALLIQPTRTDDDGTFARRPWLEHIDGVSNLPAGTDMAAAFACFAPQGINGCGFESPLESMYLALARAKAEDESNFGFLRRNALLAIVIVTDEVDCSYDKDWGDIFAESGTKQFWSDPSAMWPTSALCWNAGVECFGDPSQYDGCEPVDLDIAGQPAGPDEAVLHPLRRYVDRLHEIRDDKWQYGYFDADVIVALIGGVTSDGSVVYAAADEPEFQDQFGIGPGCVGPLGQTALPPVRLRALVDEFTPGNVHSICDADYTGALESIAEVIHGRLYPTCYPRCVADRDPETALVEPSCTVQMRVNGSWVPVPECLRTAEGTYAGDPIAGTFEMPNDAVDTCIGIRTDADMHTPDPRDDVDAYCTDHFVNLQFEIVHRPGVPRESDDLTAICEPSDEPELDCP